MSYWEKAVLKLWPDAVEIREEWERKTVSFELYDSRGVEVKIPKNLQVFGNDVRMSIHARGDDRYKDQGTVGAVVRVTLHDVLFPDRPEPT